MRCRDVRRLLVTEGAAVYGLPVFGMIDRHLSDCESCRREADRLESEASLYRRVLFDLPIQDDFGERVWYRIRSRSRSR
jgi:hypothetical protein